VWRLRKKKKRENVDFIHTTAYSGIVSVKAYLVIGRMKHNKYLGAMTLCRLLPIIEKVSKLIKLAPNLVETKSLSIM
jgi:hypothetical protein